MIESMVHPTEYAARVVRGHENVNRNVMLACRRHMHDLEREDIFFDEEEYSDLKDFIAQLVVADGHQLTGEPIRILPWQAFFIGSVLCWKFKETGGIRYKQSWIEIARGAGKSTLLGVMMLWVSVRYEGSESVCLANKVDQARQAFDAAAKIAMRSFGDWRSEDEEEKRNAMYEVTTREIRCRSTKSKFRPMASKTSTLDGLKCVFYACDETAEAVEDYMQKIISALPKLQTSFMVSVTTPGSVEMGLDSPYYHRRRVADEAIKEENWVKNEDGLDVFVLFYGIDEEDDYRNEACWAKAQPSLGHIIAFSDYRRLLKEYEAQDAVHNWIRYQMCAYTTEGLSWLQVSDWRTAYGELADPLPGTPIYAAVDFSKAWDITSLCWGYWADGKLQVRWHHWIVRDAHIHSIKRHYQNFVENWSEKENVTLCSSKIQYDLVRQKIEELKTLGNLQRVGYDALGGMKTEVQNWGDVEENYNPAIDLPMWSLPQTIVSMGPGTYQLESFLRNENLALEDDTIVEYALAGVQLQESVNGDRRPCKQKSTNIIDPIVACVMLCAVLIREGAERPGAYADLKDIAC
tara:strand:- start:647 stop:2374 length:1728 start_codon:yes stop_codon:yes gene_type:complete